MFADFIEFSTNGNKRLLNRSKIEDVILNEDEPTIVKVYFHNAGDDDRHGKVFYMLDTEAEALTVFNLIKNGK